MSHRDILKKLPYLYFFDYRVSIREKKGRHMLCRIFRPIDWYHSLFPPQIFFRSSSGFRPFFGIPLLDRNSKTAHFWDMVPILSSHFFQFLIEWPIHFFGGLRFFENFSYILLNLTRSEEFLFWEKTVSSVNFHFRVIDNGEWDGCRNGGYLVADAGTEGDELLHCTDWCLCLGRHIAKYLEMTLQSATNV